MLQMYTGFAIIILMFLFDRSKLDIKLDKVSKFLAFMAIVTAFRLALHSFHNTPPSTEIINIPFYLFALVPWEDAFYVAPLLYIDEMRQEGRVKEWVWKLLVVISSVTFGLGHAYQGLFGVLLTSIYPYFVSFKYSKRVGMGTVMVCHVLYDMITYATAKFGWVVNL
jgi:hypothetical protein